MGSLTVTLHSLIQGARNTVQTRGFSNSKDFEQHHQLLESNPTEPRREATAPESGV